MIVGRSGNLVDAQATVLPRDEVGKGAADVNADIDRRVDRCVVRVVARIHLIFSGIDNG